MSNPTENTGSIPISEASENAKLPLSSSSSSEGYTKIEQGGLDYIKKKKGYLIVSAAFPIYVMIIEILTAIFFLQSSPLNPMVKREVAYHVLVPSFGGLFILILSIFQLFFLLRWRQKLQLYEAQKSDPNLHQSDIKSGNDDSEVIPEKSMSLTRLFYEIVDHMEKIRILFLIFNIVAIYSIVFVINFFFFNRRPININNRGTPVMRWLNLSSSIILFLYLLFEWLHFIKWNRKLTHLRAFEKRVYAELDL